MLRHTISHARLMRVSTDRVQTALKSSDNNEQLVARRILENPSVWSQWEKEHSGLMRQLANCSRPVLKQRTRLKDQQRRKSPLY